MLMVDNSGLEDRECHVQCRWQRVTEYVYYQILRPGSWNKEKIKSTLPLVPECYVFWDVGDWNGFSDPQSALMTTVWCIYYFHFSCDTVNMNQQCQILRKQWVFYQEEAEVQHQFQPLCREIIIFQIQLLSILKTHPMVH